MKLDIICFWVKGKRSAEYNEEREWSTWMGNKNGWGWERMKRIGGDGPNSKAYPPLEGMARGEEWMAMKRGRKGGSFWLIANIGLGHFCGPKPGQPLKRPIHRHHFAQNWH
jgi:hypothetical protein